MSEHINEDLEAGHADGLASQPVCNADLDHPCDANDGEPCDSCVTAEAELKAYRGALYAREHHYTEAELRDCYSDPTEYAKREILLSRLGEE